MTTEQITMLVVGISLLIDIIVAYLTRRDYFKYSQLIKPILNAIVGVLKAVGGVFPDNKVIKEITTVVSASVQAAGHAEELWLQGEINKADRPYHAQAYIETILKEAGIQVDNSVKTIISGVIAITCYLMPHYDVEKVEEE